ncbi:hypothetical protein A616_28840 [Brevibacillus brevis X23]|nr:hypothetical protein A616_28840 [Brevibacillus brevis X23]
MHKNMTLINNWAAPYGAYDCIFNAAVFWLELYELKTNPLYQYNWGFFYDPETDIFGPNVPKQSLLSFLREIYGSDLKEIMFEIPKNEWLMIALNTYELSYIKDLYQRVEQNHYVLAFWDGNNVTICDPFYKYFETISLSRFYKLWSRFMVPIIVLSEPNTSQIININYITPYILQTDYRKQYHKTTAQIVAQLCKLESGIQNKELDETLKRYFGCFRSFILNRYKHFQDDLKNPYKLKIVGGWSAILKTLFLILSGKHMDVQKIIQMLLNIVELELEYLETLSGKDTCSCIGVN